MTARDAEELGLDIAIGNRRKYTLPRLVAERLAGAPRFHEINEKIMTDESWDALSLDRPRLHTRAFLKVQDGCAHYCAYCIVPFVRGKPVSRPMDEAVEEARRITESGCPEIVLTGIHLGLYENLPELVRRIGGLPKLKRLRFGSIEPFAVDEALLAALAETPAFCEHLHMPLQSGDAGVLADMRRGYAPEEFAKVAERARAALGDELHISTDLMIGFPTESRAAFRNSMDFIKSVGFGKIHVFPYSPRGGTKAAAMPPVPEAELKERTAEALEAAAELHEKFCVRRLGRDITILTEEIKNGAARGLTRNYIRAEAPARGARVNEELTLTPRAIRGRDALRRGDAERGLLGRNFRNIGGRGIFNGSVKNSRRVRRDARRGTAARGRGIFIRGRGRRGARGRRRIRSFAARRADWILARIRRAGEELRLGGTRARTA